MLNKKQYLELKKFERKTKKEFTKFEWRQIQNKATRLDQHFVNNGSNICVGRNLKNGWFSYTRYFLNERIGFGFIKLY